jgi:signal transduction histidine kinase/CheY-like chemotaxis protein/HPt (histidine-containing phosphotransfer) domain-containing protein
VRLKFKIVFIAAISCLTVVSILAGWSLVRLRRGVEMRKQASLAQAKLDDVLESLQQAHIDHLKYQMAGSRQELELASKQIHQAQIDFRRLMSNLATQAPEIRQRMADLDRLIDTQIANASFSGEDAPLTRDIRTAIDDLDVKLERTLNEHQLFVDKYFGLNLGALSLALIFTLALLFAFALLVSEEISRRTRLEGELRTAQSAAVSASNLKSQFVATVSHEIRTPLNGIIGMSELLRDRADGAEMRRYAEILHNSGRNLLRIVNDILDFSKIEADKIEFEMQEVCPAQIIENAIELFARKAEDKKLALIGDYAAEFRDIVATDGSRIAQVVHNLLGNAIKFTDSGSVRLSGGIRRGADGVTVLQFDLRDTGCGFSTATGKTLFQPFHQLSNARDREGTGLGLAISKRLVENMNGQIGYASAPGEGAHFWFRIPVKGLRPAVAVAGAPADSNRKAIGVGLSPLIDEFLRGHTGILPFAYGGAGQWPNEFSADDVILIPEHMPMLMPSSPDAARLVRLPEQISPDRLGRALRAALSTEAEATLASPSMPAAEDENALLLLVEDNATNQLLAQTLLEGLGYRVHTVANGEECLQALRQVNYALILMDCRMPVMDGFEATRRIRSQELQEGRRRLPIIAMTANAIEGDREKCLGAGMDDYVTKPFDPRRLNDSIRRLLKSGKPEVDWNVVKHLAARTNNDVVRRLIESMAESLSASLPRIEQGVRSADWESIGSLAHQLKSSGAALGAVRLSRFCEEIETEIDGGAAPSEEKLDALVRSARRVLDEIRARRLFT